MLGYVKAFKPELKVKEYELYRGVYCSLCRNLGRRYSPLAQLFLSYDFTLAALLMLSLGDSPCRFVACRCPYNPAKKCSRCTDSTLLDRCADAVIITVFYKLADNLHDKGLSKKLLAALLYPAVMLMHKKAAACSPDIEKAVSSATAAQSKAESDPDCGIDRAADPSARALGEIFSLGFEGDSQRILYSAGYMTGRYVYILDAADDLEDDLKKGNFNPFSGCAELIGTESGRKEFAETVKKMLNFTQHEAANAFELLEMKRFGDIIKNIVYEGLDYSSAQVLSKYTLTPEERGKTKKARRNTYE